MMGWLFFAVVALVIGTIAFRRDLIAHVRDRRRNREWHRQRDEWNAKFERENPAGPPFTDAEIDAFGDWHRSLALPAILLQPADKPVGAGGSRIGGPVWLAPGTEWPVDDRGVPLEFVAQIDFADLPPLADFPTSGVLQFFVGRDDLFGADFDAPDKGQARVIWVESGIERGAAHLASPLDNDRDCSPFAGAAVRRTGQPLLGRPTEMPVDGYFWRITDRLEGQLRRPGFERIEAILDGAQADRAQGHHIGGHAVFTQDDFRGPGHFDRYDRVLLRLTSADDLIWGDVGEAVFLIPRADLVARNFDAAIFYWGCS
jgi:uncharacterized protein YwqG